MNTLIGHGTPLNIPFKSEAYDRLIAAQLASAGVAVDNAFHIGVINRPVTDLRAAREKLDMTQAQLADRLNTSLPRISEWENGKPMPGYIDLAMRALLAMMK